MLKKAPIFWVMLLLFWLSSACSRTAGTERSCVYSLEGLVTSTPLFY